MSAYLTQIVKKHKIDTYGWGPTHYHPGRPACYEVICEIAERFTRRYGPFTEGVYKLPKIMHYFGRGTLEELIAELIGIDYGVHGNTFDAISRRLGRRSGYDKDYSQAVAAGVKLFVTKDLKKWRALYDLGGEIFRTEQIMHNAGQN